MSAPAAELDDIETGLLLEAIHRRYGYDFRGYARPSLERRLRRRARGERVATLSQLQSRLLRDPHVMARLLDDLTISTSSMFRDPAFFAALREAVLPRLRTYPYLRIWNAGCASGEEPWSLAILLHEEGLLGRAHIYATDLSEESLERARAGDFPLAKMKDYTASYIKSGGEREFSSYYRVDGDRARFDPGLGARFVFARHNLATDGPFNEFDLIVCRNVLIYFGKELQMRALDLFDDSLHGLGMLGLGSQESLEGTRQATRFGTLVEGERLYRKRAGMTNVGAILVVDDQPESLVALRTVLEPLGREVVTAPSGEEALKQLLGGDFSVIVMDVRMPGLDGFETVELIKRRDRHEDTAVIFLTAGDADAEQITRGYSAGAVDYILKPVDADVLRSKVAMLLELQQKNAELRASEERFRAAFEGAPIGMGLTTVDGRWLEVNEALCELLGRTQTQLVEQPLWELAHPADREQERDAVRRLLRDRPLFDQSEKRFMRRNGDVVHALVSVSLTADGHDRPQGYIWQLVDVTEQRRAEAERAARAEAEAVAQTIGRLQQVTEAALEHLALRDLLDVLVERLGEVFGADIVRILLQDDEDEQLYLVGATSGLDSAEPGMPVEIGSALDAVVSATRPVTLQELPVGAGLDPDDGRGGRALADGVATCGQWPAGGCRRGGHALGAAFLDRGREPADPDGRPGRAWPSSTPARTSARSRMSRCSSAACCPDRLPNIEGIQIAARYMPGGADVGGDWYDAIPLDSGGVGVAMGDVVGHGIGAASLMGQLRHATRAYALEGHTPAGVLDRLDRLVRSLDGGQMATLLYLVVEPDHGTIHFASAGHVPPLAIGPRRRGGVPRERAEPAARRLRERGPQGAHRRAGAGHHDRALHGRAGGGARRFDRPGARRPAAGSGAGHLPPGRALRPSGRGDAGDPPRERRHRRAGVARAAHGARRRYGSSSPPTPPSLA